MPRSIAATLAGRTGVRIIRRAYEREADPFFGESEPGAEDAELVCDSSLSVYSTEPAEASGFVAFSDGAQTERPAFFDGAMPGNLAFVNAGIFSRRDGDILSHDGKYAERLAVYVPAGCVCGDMLSGQGYDVERVKVEPDQGMAGMSQAIRSAVGTCRDALERGLVFDWMSRRDSWLCVDGGISQVCARAAGFHRVVGVVKSHRKQYFANHEATSRVLGLGPGERTSVFIAKTGQRSDRAYSWYLRLRANNDESPSYGLIRVEMPPVDESLEWVERVSQWLLAERAPLSLPDVRFDRLLYPIRLVEMHLRARRPSDAALAGMIGG